MVWICCLAESSKSWLPTAEISWYLGHGAEKTDKADNTDDKRALMKPLLMQRQSKYIGYPLQPTPELETCSDNHCDMSSVQEDSAIPKP